MLLILRFQIYWNFFVFQYERHFKNNAKSIAYQKPSPVSLICLNIVYIYACAKFADCPTSAFITTNCLVFSVTTYFMPVEVHYNKRKFV